MRFPIVLLLCGSLWGCAVFKKTVRMPDLAVEGVRVAGLSFQDIDLVFDLGVDNPNSLPVTLAGFDYELLVEGNSFLKGRQEESTRIAAAGRSVVQLPLTLDFGDLRRAFAALAGQDSAGYELVGELTFDLPVLGVRRRPLRHSGRVPVVEPPRIEVGDLKIERLNLTGADLVLELRLANPNSFALELHRLDYQFAVDGATWASGAADRPVKLEGKGAQTATIPIALDFLRIGATAYRVLVKKEPLDYRLTGQLDLGTALPMLPRAVLPVDLSGSLEVWR